MIILSNQEVVLRALNRMGRDLDNPSWVNTGIVQGLNKAGMSALGLLRKTVAKEMGVTAKSLKKQIREEKKLSSKVAAREQTFKIKAFGKSLRLIHFVTYKKKYQKLTRKNKVKGVVAKVWGQRKVYKDTFIATVYYNKGEFNLDGTGDTEAQGVFSREGNAPRLPIKQLYGPGVAREVQRHEKVARDKYMERAAVEIPRAIEFNLSKRIDKWGTTKAGGTTS